MQATGSATELPKALGLGGLGLGFRVEGLGIGSRVQGWGIGIGSLLGLGPKIPRFQALQETRFGVS